jgi:hypothetical protein
MFKRFLSSDTAAVEVKNLTYRNSRILVLKSELHAALPFEVRIDFARETIRFKNADDALAHAKSVVDASREALAQELASSNGAALA